MEFFDSFVVPPSPGYLTLLRYLLVLTLLINVTYLAIVLGATLLSVALNWFDRDRKVPTGPNFGRLSKDVMDMVLPNRAVPLVLGILPLLSLYLIYGQWLHQSAANTMNLLGVGAALVALSFVPAMSYHGTLRPGGKNPFSNFVTGQVAAGGLLLGTYILIGAIVRFQDPERWVFTHSAVRTLTSFNIIWKYLYFVLSGLAITGCGILYFFFDWGGRKPKMDEQYATWTKNFGAGLAMKAVFLLPLIGFFYLVTTPILARSVAVYRVAAASLIVMFIIALLLYFALLSRRPRFGRATFVLFLAVFLLMGVGDQLTLVNATREHSAGLVTQWEVKEAQIAQEREKALGAAIQIDLAKGEEVFKTVCMTCHRLDEQLVGPPLNTVLPKYHGKMDELVAFIQKPSKKNPDYPPMPAPGLSLGDTRSVAAFLLGENGDSGDGDGDGTEEDSSGGH